MRASAIYRREKYKSFGYTSYIDAGPKGMLIRRMNATASLLIRHYSLDLRIYEWKPQIYCNTTSFAKLRPTEERC